MLFNSHTFLFLFLPVTWLGWKILARRAGAEIALGWLVAASLFFYGWWDARYLLLLVPSTLVNYAIGTWLSRRPELGPAGGRRVTLIVGLMANVAVLGWFKYANFFADNLNRAFDLGWQLPEVILPLGISFFTFQKVAYLVDAYQGHARGYSLLRFSLFVFFFPQLIAGPIVHHHEILSQLDDPSVFRPQPSNLTRGVTLFIAGLFKKAVLADTLAVYAKPVFAAALGGQEPTMIESWLGVLAYTFQLYFDFAGYSEMALGLGLLFNLRLPLNFNSPYQATSIIDFWRRWHMTLSRFLQQYVYFPLGGNRKGKTRRYLNLLATMLIGGFWHGANWTFVFWGLLHGLYLSVNHAWRGFRGERPETWLGRSLGRGLTFLAVVVAWVFFRAENFPAAARILRGMVGMNGVPLPDSYARLAAPLGLSTAQLPLFQGTEQIAMVSLAALLCFALPNVAQAFEFLPGGRWQWRGTRRQAVAAGLALGAAILSLNRPSEFLYFQF